MSVETENSEDELQGLIEPKRIKEMTEKGKAYQIQLFEQDRISAQCNWRKQLNKIDDLLVDSESPSVLKHKHSFLESRMEIMSVRKARKCSREHGGTTLRNREIAT